MPERWIADRTCTFDSSGIRSVFDLAARLPDPINLSIGQPDFDVPQPVQEACVAAIRQGRNGYAQTQGVPVLRDKLQAQVDRQYGHADRQLFVSSGTSGGLVLAMLALVNPGDEVIVFDPYFVMYPPLVSLAGGRPVVVDTYPDFRIDLPRLAAAISPRTKMILLNSPANPTGVVATRSEVEGISRLAQQQGIALVSDEIYSGFCYDDPFVSPAEFNPQTIVIDGFSKSHAMTGWRVGYAHGPSAVIEAMIKLQQYTFVCAPQPAQWAAATALEVDMGQQMAAYRQKRDRVIQGLAGSYCLVPSSGAFYVFPQVPWGTGSSFVRQAIQQDLLIIPGHIFSGHDTHFRISYAAPDQTIQRGIEVLKRLADQCPEENT